MFNAPFKTKNQEYQGQKRGNVWRLRKEDHRIFAVQNEKNSCDLNILNGYVKKQNCRIWSEANPQAYVETPLHPEKLTVLCALWAGGVIGSYFFKNDDATTSCGSNKTAQHVTGVVVRKGVPARSTIDFLKDTFGDRLISRLGPVNWPPRSCDLTPLDYFLYGYVK
ncbi:transposable element Tc3 transposase [Trichonephila clavipes]|nr:transposable element Tc3 transposase [Trichonephila clavipes]